MIGKRILVPVDLAQKSFDALEFVAALAQQMPVFASVLHVVNLTVPLPSLRVHDDLCREHERKLRGLAGRFFGGELPDTRVRVGRPHLEILAEAEAEQTELIVMASPKALRRKWRFSSTTLERVVRDAPCLTLVLPRIWKATPEEYRKTAIRPDAFRAGRPDLWRQ